MKSSDWIAIVSIVSTALVSAYATYSQYEANKFQEERIIELEQYKQKNQIALMAEQSRIDRFNKYCSKVESTIVEAAKLKTMSETDSNSKSFQNELQLNVIEFIYLLPSDTKTVVFEKIRDGKDPIEIILGSLQFTYEKCLGENS